jgi:peroxiredoxin
MNRKSNNEKRVILSGGKRSRRTPWKCRRVTQRDSSTSLGMTAAIRHSLFITSLIFIGLLLRSGECASPPPTSAVADNRLPTPQSETERKYLRLSGTAERFSLDNVQADILVLDFFDMYCHVCQARAGHMNDFYKLVQSRGLSGRVRVLGIGVGDTPKEVTVFKEKFGLPFPVFPDRTGSFSRQFGKIRVPNIIVLKRRVGHFEVVYQESSLPDNAEQFLSKVLSYATMKFSLPVAENAKCIEDGTTKRCPIVLPGQRDVNDKEKSSASGQERREVSK